MVEERTHPVKLPQEVSMADHEIRVTQSNPIQDQRQTLSKLQRLYGGRGRQPDAFGRRQALPSEIEKLIKNRKP
jgi:hypothetical protein